MKNFIFLIIAFILLSTNAQEKENHQEITKSINDYYNLAIENIHLHLNKSVYLTNESIWFKGYVIDKKNNGLNYSTTNVYVRIIDENKNEISSKLFLASNGVVIGQFQLNENYSSGKYFIHTYTNFMNNFEEDESSLYQIEIINTKDQLLTNFNDKIDSESISYSFEGGKFLLETANTIGIHIKNCHGEGVKISNIKVYDSKNNLINQFATNSKGFGKFDLQTVNNEQYKLVIEEIGKNIEKKLPLPSTEGIALNINNYSDENKVSIKIKTNDYTFKKNKEKKFALLIQKNDQINIIDFQLKDLSTDIILDKIALFNGINTIRIIDENNNSIAERIIYNHSKNQSNIILEKQSVINDTLSVKGLLKDRFANFSISVLPNETISSFEENAITTQLRFNNYLLHNLKNYSYYFKDFNRKKQFELDLFLLNQHIPKYDWNNIKSKKPSIKYPFDIGLTIEGTVNQSIPNKDKYTLNLSSISNGINLNSKIDNNNNFIFENIIATDSTYFFLSLLNEKSKYEDLKLYSKVSNNKNRFLKILPEFQTKCPNKTFISSGEFNPEFPYPDNTTILNEITLKDKVEKKLENEKNPYNRAGSQGYKIDQDKADMYYDVLGFIASHGYDVRTVGPQVMIVSRNSNSFKGTVSPALFIDDAPASMDLLLNMSLNSVDEIYINKNGFGSGMTAPVGSIRIYTKKQFGGVARQKINSKSLLIKDGFQKEISFKNPVYAYYENQSFKKYGTINWIPNVYTDENGSFEFEIPTLKQKKFLVNIQGIDSEGNLYYENFTIEIN